MIKNLIFNFSRLINRIIFLRTIQRVVTPSIACKLQNLILFLRQSQLRFYYDKKSKLYIAKELKKKIYFGDRYRGFNLYGSSLYRRGETLATSYGLKNIKFNKSDVVVDCGANYGDLFIYLDGKIHEKNYISFEPAPIEYKCIRMNIPKGRNFNLGLSNCEGEKKFYLSSATADSSLIKPKQYFKIIKVKVTKLDLINTLTEIKRCKLLKLEAEGGEPEILDCATKFMKICEYIAIDGSPERGVNRQLTFQYLNNKLLKNNFLMVDIFGSGYRALYKNSEKKFKDFF